MFPPIHAPHTEALAGKLQERVEHVRQDPQEVSDPRAAFVDFGERNEEAWKP